MRRSRTDPDQGPHVRPGRRPIRRAASTAASSNRLRRRRYAGQRGVALRSPASTRRRRGAVSRWASMSRSWPRRSRNRWATGWTWGAARWRFSDLDGLVVVGSGELGHERRAIGKSERAHAPRRPERDPHAVVVPRGLELAERQHAAEHLGLSGASAPGRRPRRAPPTRPGLRTRRRRPGRWRGSRRGSGEPKRLTSPLARTTTGGIRSAHGAARLEGRGRRAAPPPPGGAGPRSGSPPEARRA